MNARLFRRGAWVPRTIEYRCHRCLLVLPSKPLGKLGVYPLPEGWALIPRPPGEPDWCRCVECRKDVARGAPEVLR